MAHKEREQRMCAFQRGFQNGRQKIKDNQLKPNTYSDHPSPAPFGTGLSLFPNPLI